MPPRKKKATEVQEDSSGSKDSASSSSKRKSKDTDEKSAKKAKTEDSANKIDAKGKIPDISNMDFECAAKSSEGKDWNLKISSWNVNGLRAWMEKNSTSFIEKERPDIFCIQETKCAEDKIPADMKDFPNYYSYWLSGDQQGYSGVGLLSKKKPIKVTYGIDIEKHDKEGRVVTAEYKDFYLVNVYVPNAGRGLVRLEYRQEWDKDLRQYLNDLDKQKPVIMCGDLNVAHEEIDIANPKSNKKSAGFTKEERDGFSELLQVGYIDSFRVLHPEEKGAYTFWTYMANSRERNVGWRLDYFVLSNRLREKLCESTIRKDVHGSDHCPVTLFMSM